MVDVPLAILAMAVLLTVFVAISVAAMHDQASNAERGRATRGPLEPGADETTA